MRWTVWSKNGHADVVKWLHQNRTEGCTGFALVKYTNVLKWLQETDHSLTGDSINIQFSSVLASAKTSGRNFSPNDSAALKANDTKYQFVEEV